MASELIRNEVQVLRVASSAANASSDSIAGNFRLSWGEGGEETDYLPADVGEVELKRLWKRWWKSAKFRWGLSTDLTRSACDTQPNTCCSAVGFPRI